MELQMQKVREPSNNGRLLDMILSHLIDCQVNGEKKVSGENWLCDCNGCWCINGTVFSTKRNCRDRPGGQLFVFRSLDLCPVPCSSNFDCIGVKGKSVCKQRLKGGTKTCEPASSCPASKLPAVAQKGPKKYGALATPTQKLCEDEQFCDSTNKCQMDTEDSCGTNTDCAQLNIEKRFCLNAGLVKHCVPKSPCPAPCTDLQICDKREKTCKDPSKTIMFKTSSFRYPTFISELYNNYYQELLS